MADYISAARSLALPVDDPPSPPDTPRRSSLSRSYVRNTYDRPPPPPPTFKQRLVRQSNSIGARLFRICSKLTRRQWILLGLGILNAIVVGVIFGKYQSRIFGTLATIAKTLRGTKGAWLILWTWKFAVAFPPLFGGSTAITLAGIVYGLWKGWLLVASATIAGSTASFLISRLLFKDFITRRVANDKRFEALALVLKHDGLKLLIMIRFCPLPYSLANGAIAMIPTVSWPEFAFATACTTPMLFLPIFTGNRLGAIAEHGDTMDTGTKVISYLSIIFGIAVGITTGTVIYRKTKARAEELRVQEAQGSIAGVGDDEAGRYRDEEHFYSGDEARQDAISLHTTRGGKDLYQDELLDGVEHEQRSRSWDNVFGQHDDDFEGTYKDEGQARI